MIALTESSVDTQALTLVSVVKQVLDRRAFAYSVEETEARLMVSFRAAGTHQTYDIFVLPNEMAHRLVVYARSSHRVAENLRSLAAEFINRINHKSTVGNLEMNPDDGTVDFRIGTDVEGVIVTPQMVDNLIVHAIWTFDFCFPALVRVLYCLKSPADAITELFIQPSGS
jgi:hypothetical protein